jgi:WD40 repeat protein
MHRLASLVMADNYSSFSSIGQKGDRIIVPDAHSGVHVIPLSENKSSFLLRYYPDPSTHAINFGAAFTSNDVLVASGHRGRIVVWNVCKRKIVQVLSHPGKPLMHTRFLSHMHNLLFLLAW